MKFKYSIIIPHYNSTEELKRLLDSIPTRRDIQVIVIDDKSNDSSFINVISNSKVNNIQYYFNKGTKGAGAARNIGLMHAEGQYLIFADADDYFTKDAFKIIDNETYKSETNFDIIYFNATSIDSNGHTGFRHVKISSLIDNFINKRGKNYIEKLKYNHQGPCAKLYRNEFISSNSIKFDQTIVANDGIFTFKAAKNSKKIRVSKEIIYCITQSDNSLTTEKNIENYRLRLEVFVKCYKYLSDSERAKVGISPLPILYLGRQYGFIELIRSINYLKNNNIQILQNPPLSRDKFKNLYIRTFKNRVRR